MFGRLFKNKKQNAVTADHNLNQIYYALQQSLRNREFMDVTVPGDDYSYQSMILEIDPEERTLLIDEFFPNSLRGLVGQKMQFSLRHKSGRATAFESEILESYEFDDAPVYVIRMPAELDQNQRRAVFRLALPSSNLVESWFLAPDKNEHAAKVRDLSVSGVCLQSENELVRTLVPGDRLTDVAFEFAGIPIACDLKVRNLGERGRIGAEFERLPHNIYHRLQQAIVQIQREQLRYSDKQRSLLAGG